LPTSGVQPVALVDAHRIATRHDPNLEQQHAFSGDGRDPEGVMCELPTDAVAHDDSTAIWLTNGL
jgi:hypothetical protein